MSEPTVAATHPRAERCPKCHRRTFHTFIDPQSGMFGRCAREACGYELDMEDDDGEL